MNGAGIAGKAHSDPAAAAGQSPDRHSEDEEYARLSFVYFVLSLLASAVQEWIAAVLALRSRTHEKGLQSMLAEDDKLLTGSNVPVAAPTRLRANLLEDFYAHPLIRSLYNTKGARPVQARRERGHRSGRTAGCRPTSPPIPSRSR